MDFISGSKNTGSSAGIGSSGSDSGSGNGGGGGGGMFSNFFNLSLQKMVLLLAMIAFVISVGTVAILLWKSKSAQKWPPEIAKCPDRMVISSDGTSCSDPYGLYTGTIASSSTSNCDNYNTIKGIPAYNGLAGSEGYIPWEGILDGKSSKSSSLKCSL
jgi:hypothetical protein